MRYAQARNIVRLGGSYAFVDLDAVASIGSDRCSVCRVMSASTGCNFCYSCSVEGLAFAKYSSACLPPEAIVIFDDRSAIVTTLNFPGLVFHWHHHAATAAPQLR
jgi:hypothetical protein